MRRYNKNKLLLAKIIDIPLRVLYKTLKKIGVITKNITSTTNNPPPKILVMEYFLIGDFVMSTPAFKSIRKKYPDAYIALLCSPPCKELIVHSVIFDEIIEFKCPWATYDYSVNNIKNMICLITRLRKIEWDLCIALRGDFRNNIFMYLTGAKRRVGYGFTGGEYLLTDVVPYIKSLKHQVDGNLAIVEYIGCDVSDRKLEIWVGDEARKWSDKIFNDYSVNDQKPKIAIHPGAGRKHKLWEADRFAQLADRLVEKYSANIFLLSHPSIENIVSDITKYMKHKPIVIDTSVSRLSALMQRCDIFIGLDSGATHMAAALGIPIVALYGPQSPDLAKPYTNSNLCSIIYKGEYSCRPCNYGRCRSNPGCMDIITVNDVWKAVTEKLEMIFRMEDSGISDSGT